VVVDYFTKWVEAEVLASITTTYMIKFFKRNVLARFSISQSVVTDNGSKFIDKKMHKLMKNLNIKQHFAFVEHPQTNGQDEVANKVILRGLKKRLDEAKCN
jgi:IS30 family transposase